MVAPVDMVQLPDKEPLLLSELVDSVKTNYAIAYGNRLQLEALQAWVRKQINLYSD
jgi:hypothetical protein